MKILHISADYPDPVQPQKTRAVANLLALVPEHEHRVVSLNRRGRLLEPATWQGGTAVQPFADDAGRHWAMTYQAPPKGLFHKRFLDHLVRRIEALTTADGLAPALIHAHKLTVEGIVAWGLAARLGVPFLLTVQGNTDLKIVGARPDLRRHFAAIWHEAAVVLPFAPWAAAALERRLGSRAGPVTPLPCPGPADALLPPRPRAPDEPPLIVSAFNLSHARNKNAVRLIRAAARAAEEIPDLRLEIVGAGDPGPLAALAGRVLPGRVAFRGPVTHAEVQSRFNRATAFAMVSHRETFGMVFSEALLAGTPCLYPRGRAIEGYLPEGGVILAADPRNEADIAGALVRLIREERDFKARLAAQQDAGGLDFLRRPAIAATYRDALACVAG